jgi:hypothetical protein
MKSKLAKFGRTTTAFKGPTEPTNQERADRIRQIIETIAPYNEDSDDWQSGVTNILTDLMHFCRKNKTDPYGNDLNFDKELEMARINFEAEIEEEAYGTVATPAMLRIPEDQ